MKSLTLTALDIGTNSIRAVCGTKDLKTGEVKVLARTQLPCLGVRNGEIIKPEQVGRAVEAAVKELNQKANLKIRDCWATIGGSHIFSLESQGLVSVARADQKISSEDVQRVLKAAQSVNLPKNKEVVDVFAQEFIVDGEAGIKDPLGLMGIRLEVKVLLACLFSPLLENLEKAIGGAGLALIDVSAAPMASSKVILNDEQKELGVMLLEIGAGSTNVAVFEKGDLKDFAIFPVGSANITNDIAIGFRTEIQTAEKIKLDFAALPGAISEKRKLLKARPKPTKKAKDNRPDAEKPAPEASGFPETGVEFSLKLLDSIVEARIGQIITETQKSMKKYLAGQSLPAGVVLAGGGAGLPGLVEYARQKFKLPCRLGKIQGFSDFNDLQWSGALGLLLTGFEAEEDSDGQTGLAASGIKEKFKRAIKSFLP
ncbi:MAG: cell division protein FtsA [Candidatus Pacebacteria bacterium]|nr:cell division protein FtsA [Candidatus Paceibacterota bacterium]